MPVYKIIIGVVCTGLFAYGLASEPNGESRFASAINAILGFGIAWAFA